MPGLRHPTEWGRDHPLIVDGLIAGGLAGVGLLTEATQDPVEAFREPDAFGVLLTLAATLPLVLRRRHPLVTYLVIAVPAAAYMVLEYGGGGPFIGLLFGLYAVAAHAASRRPGMYCLVGSLAVIAAGFIADHKDTRLADVVGVLAFFLSSWVLGDSMRVRRAYFAAVEDRAAQLEREQDVLAQRAVLEERSRIARELHDIVAHSMSVMVVQAGAARRTLDRDPAQAIESITQIESTGRSALDEMRRLVGVLRRGEAGDGERRRSDDPASRLPQPGIDQLPDLVRSCRDAGLDVSMQVDGETRPLPSGVELVVYRVVQEALTNTMQHAGPAQAAVDLRFGDVAISLSVTDDGRGAATDGGSGRDRPDARPRHGLAGMRERVALYNGEIATGPRPGGGFGVWVTIPLSESVRAMMASGEYDALDASASDADEADPGGAGEPAETAESAP